MKPITCKTQWHIVTAYLWSLRNLPQNERWIPTSKLQGIATPYGFPGSAAEQRARELAADNERLVELHPELKDKVESRRGSEIGLDPRFTYFAYKTKPSASEFATRAKRMCELFDAGASVEQIFAV